MPWVALSFVVSRPQIAEASRVLFANGASGTQEEHLPGKAPPPRQPWDTGPAPRPPRRVVLKAWFEDPDRPRIEDALAAAVGRVAATWEPVVEEDWEESWKANFPPIEVSPRLRIAAPWDARPGDIVIEPGQGFGTGQHPTTLAVLAMLDAIADGYASALDLGCGSGILALAAARLGLRAEGVDNDPVAVTDALGNAARNDLVVPFHGTAIADLAEPADVVMANLFAEVLAENADDLVRLTRHELLLAGILAEREAVVRAAFDARLPLVERRVDGEWVALRYARGGQ